MEELMESIKKSGIINPIEVDKTGQIITGERRYTAAKKLGLTEIPVKVIELDEEATVLRQLHENLAREDMSLYDTALFYRKMMDTLGIGKTALAERLGIDPSKMTETMSVFRYTEKQQDVLKQIEVSAKNMGNISRIRTLEEKDLVAEGTTDALIEAVKEKVWMGETLNRVIQSIRSHPAKAQKILAVRGSLSEVSAWLDKEAPTMWMQISRNSITGQGISNAVIKATQLLNIDPMRLRPVARERIRLEVKELAKVIQPWLNP